MTVVSSRRKVVLKETPLFDWFDRNKVNPSGAAVRHRQPKPRFPGPAFDAELDEIRLSKLQFAAYDLMKDAQWRTHSEIKAKIGRGSENGIAAMLRNLRSKNRGGHTVNKRRRGNPEAGLWEYQLVVNPRTRIQLKGK